MLKNNIYRYMMKFKGIDYIKLLKKINQIQNIDDLKNFQEKKLKSLIIHANKNVPYYHNIFKKIDIINDIVDLSKFKNIPILTKEILSNHNNDLISKDIKKRNWYYNRSGGSTGNPVKFVQDKYYNSWSIATNQYYYKNIVNIDELRVKKISLWGSERDIFKKNIVFKTKLSQWLTNTIILNSFKMTNEDLKWYIEIINSYKPKLIRGYAGALYELCRFAQEKDMNIYSPNVISSAAETLTDEMRNKIENVFHTKVFDFYGSRETASIAGECKSGLMHIFSFNHYVEILDDKNKPVNKGELGRVIVTSLHNYSMPLIRYELGDMAILGNDKCNCGNFLPTLEKITGRVVDHLVKKDGTLVPAEFFIYLFVILYNELFKKFQIIQKDYDKIKIFAIVKKKITDYEKKEIEDKIKLVMGNYCIVDWEFVEEIPKTKSGKQLYIKSMIQK